jgi:[ribosomal protein S5]-alanine N-acetyltransferase
MTICQRICAARIQLEPLIESHAAALFLLLQDEALWEFTDEAPPESLAALRARYRRLESRRSADGAQLWLNWAIALYDGTVMGLVQATVAANRNSIEIAYILGRPFWSHGFAHEAVGAMIADIEESLGFVEFMATVDCRNVASERLLGRLGFIAVDTSDPQNVLWRRQIPQSPRHCSAARPVPG